MSYVGRHHPQRTMPAAVNAHAPVSGENRTPALVLGILGKRCITVKHGNGFLRMWERFKAWHGLMTRALPFGPNILRKAMKVATEPVEVKRAMTRKDLRHV